MGSVEVPRDNVLHRIWVAAPGFRPKAEWVRFDAAELAVNIVLDPRTSTRQAHDESTGREALRRPSAAPAATETSPPAPAPQAETAPVLRELDFRPVKRAPLPSLDTDDPWKK